MRGMTASAEGHASSIWRIERCGLHPSVATMRMPPESRRLSDVRYAIPDQQSDVPHIAGDAALATAIDDGLLIGPRLAAIERYVPIWVVGPVRESRRELARPG